MSTVLTYRATPADLAAGQALVDAANAALIADCGYASDDTALLLPVTVGDEIVVRDGVTWYSVSDATSMPWVGWISASTSGANGLALTDAAVDDLDEDPANF